MKQLKSDVRLIYKGFMKIRQIRPWMLSLVVIRSVFEAISPFITIYMSALIIDGIIAKYDFNTLITYAMLAITFNFIAVISIKILDKNINLFYEEFNHKFDMILSQKIADIDYANVENPQTHQKLQKIKELRNLNGTGIWNLFSSASLITKNFFKIIFSISLTFSLFTLNGNNDSSNILNFATSKLCSILLISCIVINVILTMYSNSTSKKNYFAILNGFVPLNRIYFYYFTNFIASYHAGKDTRIYNQKNLILSKQNDINNNARLITSKIGKNEIKYSSITIISTIIITTLVYLFVSLKALAGLYGVGSIVKYVGSINEFIDSFTTFMNEFASLRANNEGLIACFDFLDIKNVLYQGTLPVEKRYACDNGDNDYEIEFCNVSFKYPSSEDYALKNVSAKLKIGKRLAVVGMNGSGKTTFIKLLCRLYDPTEGIIKLNGVDIRKYDFKEYYSLFSVVFQDFKLFSFPLGQNVGSTVDYDIVKVEETLAKVGFTKRYSKMKKGCNTFLYKDFEEDGVEISGGEAQKIALARALYKDAPFIVLDEPTSALDPVAEFEIYSKFNEVVSNRTAIYISHRLSSCRFCDDIAVFHEGKLIQRGNHDTLLANDKGKYHELWNAQAQYYA
ncbi:ABC transporter ATP-binding protein [Clostridiaceae bacterium M8S5]|nr:ABC transporter ATP-binding protein [Clostridiaceae bacterium M8S5]